MTHALHLRLKARILMKIPEIDSLIHCKLLLLMPVTGIVPITKAKCIPIKANRPPESFLPLKSHFVSREMVQRHGKMIMQRHKTVLHRNKNDNLTGKCHFVILDCRLLLSSFHVAGLQIHLSPYRGLSRDTRGLGRLRTAFYLTFSSQALPYT